MDGHTLLPDDEHKVNERRHKASPDTFSCLAFTRPSGGGLADLTRYGRVIGRSLSAVGDLGRSVIRVVRTSSTEVDRPNAAASG
jgi:hypothetical protein